MQVSRASAHQGPLTRTCIYPLVRPTGPAVAFQQVKPFGARKHSVHRPSRKHNLRVDAQRLSTQLIGGGFGSANQLFVAGADGQLGARIVQKLLQAGFKVVAGVPDEEQAQSVVDFATSVELLKKQEAQKLQLAEIDVTDESSIIAALPKRGARVMAIVGDSGAKGSKLDARAATRVLLAAQEAGASQFILVTPSGGSSGGGFFGSLFGGGAGGGSGSRPSKLEQDIASSGLDFIVIRTGRTDVQDPDFESGNNVALGAQGSLPPQSRITKNQVAEVVQEVIRLADRDVLIEAWASADAEAVSVDEAVSKVLPECTIEEEEEDEAESSLGQFAEEAQEAEFPKTPAGFFGGFGTQKLKVGSDASEPEAPAKPAFGTRRVSIRDRAKQQSNGSAPTSSKRPAFSFGGRQPEEQEEEAEEASYSPAEALRGIFGKKTKEDKQAQITPEKARRSAVQGIKAAGNAAKQATPSAARRQGRPGAEGEKPAKKGFLASIGLDTEKYSYGDDE